MPSERPPALGSIFCVWARAVPWPGSVAADAGAVAYDATNPAARTAALTAAATRVRRLMVRTPVAGAERAREGLPGGNHRDTGHLGPSNLRRIRRPRYRLSPGA